MTRKKPTAGAPTITIHLRPKYNSELNLVASVEVALEISGIRFDPNQQLLQLPIAYDNCDSIAEIISAPGFTDDIGAIAVASRTVRGGETEDKAWFGQRAVVGTLKVTYTAPVLNNTGSRGAAAPLELRNDADAVSGGASTFLLLPPSGERFNIALSWDLTEFPGDAFAVSSLGEGNVSSGAPLLVSELLETYFMAGLLGKHESSRQNTKFFAAWQGTPPYDPAPYMHWAEKLYFAYSDFFGLQTNEAYGILLRYNPVNGGGGRECYRSFLITHNERFGDAPASLRSLISHEMFHTFSPMLGRPQLPGEVLAIKDRWFFEGLAVFYECLFPCRLGMITDEEYIACINYYAARYYTSIMAELPNAALADGYWRDTRIRTLAYDRAMLYFAVINHQIADASGSARSLDNLVLEMVSLERSGTVLTNDVWESLLHDELGASGVAEFREFLSGKPPVPGPKAFGERFTRYETLMRRYELGFTPDVLTETPRIVRGIVAGSAAENAGLKNGDRILLPVPQDHLQGSQDMLITLQVARADETFDISYLPRAEAVPAFQWKVVDGG